MMLQLGMISYLNTLLGGGCNSPEEIIQKYNINKSNACKMMERGYELAKNFSQVRSW